MARLTLKGMRTGIQERAPSGGGNNIWSPMGDMNVGDTATVRLALYEDDLTGGFWTADKRIALEFINPDNDEEIWKFTVPCLEMYVKSGEGKCPVADITRGLFKQADELKDSGASDEGEAMEKIALKFWIRYSYLFQGYVIKGGTSQQNPDELIPMKFPKSLFSMIQSSVTDPSSGFAALPTGEYSMEDVTNMAAGEVTDGMGEDEFLGLFAGHNYLVRKTKKSGFNNYETGQWEMNQSSLTSEQIEYMATNGMVDLTKYLPKRPTDEQYAVMAEMAQVSIDYAMGNGDGLWNSEWEEFGLKPRKPSTDGNNSGDASGGESSGGSLKDRFKNRKSDDGKSALANNRGAAKAESAEAETETEVDAAPADDGGTTDRVAKMKAKLAAKKKASAAA
jgi:hypothetical protein